MIRIYRSDEIDRREILSRGSVGQFGAAEEAAKEIVAAVKAGGDKAVADFCRKFDGFAPSPMRVSDEEIAAAVKTVGEKFMATLREAAENIAFFHRNQRREGFELKKADGVILGQRVLPLRRAGIYVPGGRAAYPSTVLMCAVPAAEAGVSETVMTTPAGADGKVKAEILAAAAVAGVKEIYKAGGAQGIAMLAYGTETVRRVDKIVGPGNAYVAAAKKLVSGDVGIDMFAGPSEILIIADGTARPDWLAADMLSQAEHDPLASAVLVTTDERLAQQVAAEIEKKLAVLPRERIARASIESNGKIVIVRDEEEAADISDELAPEHLELVTVNPEATLGRIHNAGSVFLGAYSPEPLGDYFAGPNHTLPTSGTARFSSPLGVDDFVRRQSYIRYSGKALLRDGEKVADFAEREGLSAHARSILVRLDELNKKTGEIEK